MAPREPITFSACSGACQQGRLLCPNPQACEKPDPEDQDGPPMDRAGFYLLVLAILAAWAAMLGILHVGRLVYKLVTGA